MTVKEWKDEIAKLDDEKRKELRYAIHQLREWEAFEREFEWTNLETIETLLY